jgi:Tol biopolymer transport system component
VQVRFPHRRIGRLAPLLGLTALLVFAPLRAANATPPGPIGPIVYVDAGNHVAVVSPGGDTRWSSPLTGSSPTWAPSGDRIAYVDGGRIEVTTYAPGPGIGTSPSALPNVSDAVSVSWSPNGTAVAYSDGTNIFTIATDGSEKTQLTSVGAGSGRHNREPAWSPDGGDIAFATDRDGGYDVYLMSALDGSRQTKLTTSGSDDTAPSWSPDGSTIVFESNRDGVAQLYTVPSSGGPAQRLTNEAVADSAPSYAPSGFQVALVHGGALATASADSGAVTPVAPAAPGSEPEWGLGFGVLTPPTISPTSGLTAGTVLRATPGTWSAPSPTFTYQWQTCNAAGGACSRIDGATAAQYVVVAADSGSTFRVTVTATQSGSAASATSAATAVFQATESAVGVVATNVTLPTVSIRPPAGSSLDPGVVAVGSSLTASVGSWRGQLPIRFDYQWKKCDATGSCFAIAAATGAFFSPGADLFGWRIAVGVTGTNSLGSQHVTSIPTAAVTALAPDLSITPPVTGSNVVGETLAVAPGTWKGTQPMSFAYEWRRCDPQGDLPSCLPIPDATRPTYTLTDADQGLTLRAFITASNLAGSATEPTNHTFPTLPRPRFAPRASAQPLVVGLPTPGERLTGTVGTWTGDAPLAFTTAWQRCDATGAACTAVARATGRTYTVSAKDVGSTLRLVVTVKNPVGTVTAASDATDTIRLTPHHKGRRIVGSTHADYLGGSGFDDVILGRFGNDTLVGGAGNDTIDGGPGNDVLVGGAGVDRLLGGTGSDTIVAADGNRDAIDCGIGNDRAVVDEFDVVGKSCEMVQTTFSSPSPSPSPAPPPETTSSSTTTPPPTTTATTTTR